jgi:hypothetical protein
MKVQFAAFFTSVLVLLGAANSPLAHHSFGVEFDSTKCMDLTGPLTGIEWENPHAWLRMDVKEPSGKVQPWRLEMITPNALRRNGTTREHFESAIGKVMYARGCAARAGAFTIDGTNRGAAEFIKLADGVIRIVGQVVEREMTPEKLSFWEK